MKSIKINDSLRSLVSGLGSARDKTVSVTAAPFQPMTDDEINNLYRGNWLAQKICDLPGEDMVRDWRTWQADPQFVNAIESAERHFSLEAKVLQCLCWARQYGGAALIFGMKDRAHGQSLDHATVKQGDLEYILAVPRTAISAGEVIADPASPDYGKAETYTIRTNASEVQLHHSRVVAFRNKGGEHLSAWGDSVFDSIKSAVYQLGMSLQGSAHAMQEANVDVVMMPQLADYAATAEGRLAITERITLAQSVKGMFSMMLLGSGETYERKPLSLQSFDGLLDRFFIAAAGAADIPIARLFNKIAGTLGNNGEGELKTYYDGIATKRRRMLVPLLDRIDAIVIPAATGRPKPDGAFYTFPPLMQPTAKEMAEVSKIKADAVKIYHDLGLIPDEVLQSAIRSLLAEDTLMPGIEEHWNNFDASGDASLAAIKRDTDPDDTDDDNETGDNQT